jgi:hypothetical protein
MSIIALNLDNLLKELETEPTRDHNHPHLSVLWAMRAWPIIYPKECSTDPAWKFRQVFFEIKKHAAEIS